MKFNYFLIASLLFFIACDKDDIPIPADESLIVGKWKNTEAYISAGGPQYWIDVEDGVEIVFFEDSTFYSNRFTECTGGNFSIVENELLLEYSCDGFDSGFENEDGFIIYKLEFYSSYFNLTLKSGSFFCTEGCSSKFQKIE